MAAPRNPQAPHMPGADLPGADLPRRSPAQRLLAGGLALALLLSSFSAYPRGRKGGGLEPDLVEEAVVMQGLPVNLIPSFEPAGRIVGDGTITGFGGFPMYLATQPTLISQSGQLVTTVPVGLMDGSKRQVGVARRTGADLLPRLPSLKEVPIPETPGLSDFIRDKAAAIALGKALFWDVQAGSDGQACASCHFHAGADSRTKNQLSPGLKGGDTAFGKMASGSGGPNYQLKASDFPFHRLANPLDRESKVLFDSNDVVASQGTFGATFLGTSAGSKSGGSGSSSGGKSSGKSGDKCGPPPRDEFVVNGISTRRVEPRNTPTVINAVFNHRNFWDGRANNIFNGVNPFGLRDPNARVLVANPDGSTWLTPIALRNASLASQAVGPALSEFEMSCDGRKFGDLGRRLLALRPLGKQEVHVDDSVLGRFRAQKGNGLDITYPELIKAAFHAKWWSAPGKFATPGSTATYSHMETNFSLYWGLAIMAYEATLVSDEAPIDKFIGWAGRPGDPKALNDQQLRGLRLFRGKALCTSCHRGAEFTSAATGLQPKDDGEEVVENMVLHDGQLSHYDNGYYNIGVRPTSEDLGVGGTDPWGNSLAFARNWFGELRGKPGIDPLVVNTCNFGIHFDAMACWNTPDPNLVRLSVDGSFKTPTLRNVGLTRPYFHNGSRLTLAQVVEFYNRGGDRRGPDGNDSTGFVSADLPNGGRTNIHPDVKPLYLSLSEQADLVAFMRFGLTDRRVACKQAPFDHPGIRLTNGHAGTEKSVKDQNKDGFADDDFIDLAPVGANGVRAELCLRNDDGSRVPPS